MSPAGRRRVMVKRLTWSDRMTIRFACFAGVIGLALTLTGCSAPAPAPLATATSTPSAGGPDRTVLPIAEPKAPTYKELDARNAKPPARFEVKAPAKAPNVVIVLIDDVG